MRNLIISVLMTFCLSLPAFAIKPTQQQIQAFWQLSPQERKSIAASAGYDLQNLNAPEVKTQNQIDAPSLILPRTELQSLPAELPEGPASITPSLELESLDAQEIEEESVLESELLPFGYDLFAGEPTTFEPASYVPMSSDYIVGPGDTVVVQLYGKESAIHELKITREGRLDFPGVGPISINGLNFSELKARINLLVAEQMIGVKASITMGALRSMQIFVLGEAYKPGAYTVSALSTITHALFVSGGVSELASLRDIQLKRKGKLITRFDLYDLLLNGDTSNDVRLQPGDVVFIPPYKYTAGIRGQVKRPAIYEFSGATDVLALVKMAGGFTSEAYPGVAQVERINANGERTLIDIDLREATHLKLKNGDILTVASVLDQIEGAVLVKGHVDRPGGFKWVSGMRVSDVVNRLADLKPNPNTRFALIERKNSKDGSISVLSFDPLKALSVKGSSENLVLEPRDTLMFFGNAQDQAKTLSDLVNQLTDQARLSEYPRTVSIQGHVKFPGTFPLAKGMDVETLIQAAGGLKSDPDYQFAFLIQKNQTTGKLNPAWINLRNLDHTEILLNPLDEIYLFGEGADRQKILTPLTERLTEQSDKTRAAAVVNISGAVKYPGIYPLVDNMDVVKLIGFSGGYEETAYSLTGEITRKEIDAVQNFLIKHIKVTLSDENESKKILLRSRDHLVIKKISKWNQIKNVTLSGEIKFPGTYPITEGETLGQLLARAGGLTLHADPYGAIFLRESLKQREAKVLEQFSEELNKQLLDLEKKALSDKSEISEAKLAGASLLKDLDTAQATGRLVINLPDILNQAPNADVVLRNGDEIVVPSMIQEVSVLGEVQYPTSHLYVQKLSGKAYLNLSGGYSVLGDKRRAYVIERNGSVKPLRQKILFFFSRLKSIKPGDAIVVPPDLDRIAPLTYWAQVSQILFQLSTTAAALNTVGAF